ncbi:hypothetical protein [Parerythrobacter jejuensis]|uniref:Uncharacterized protein n=1 Tax=Parerythrobacter jejuensis TaxID=795812 RepID=A0A845AUI3_9SPHN|nr:hypothetical protein [Parerythrobacter jejuensis]MXP32166.1 hypothetical protein [Parerythrobacter jejuensis]
MRRQILTLLALLTGFAAMGVPASAAVGEMFGPQVQSGAEAKAEERREECRLRKERDRSPVKRESIKDCKPRKSVKLYLPTVMFGIDRAYE